MSKVLGIDLGTTNSAMAVMENGEPMIIPNSEGNRTTPSVVSFRKDGTRLVGERAEKQAVKNPDRTIKSIKRKMGTDHTVLIDGEEYTPEQISAMILQKLKRDAEDYLGEKINRAVISVPAYFNEPQREATKNAGEIAGFKVEKVLNGSIASAMAYRKEEEGVEKILVYDLGGGTFDVSIMEAGDGVYDVLATSGNTDLGGDDWTQKIVDHCLEEFQKETGIDLSDNREAVQRIFKASEEAKKELSSRQKTEINLPYLTSDHDGPKHLELELSRVEFENMTNSLIEKTKEPVNIALEDMDLQRDEIDKVILTGGSTRLPAIRDFVRNFFRQNPMKINPDECVAIGAAIQAGVISGATKDDIVLLDVTPLSLGVETLGGVTTTLIERNSTIPTEESKVFTTASDNQERVEIHVVQGEREMAEDNYSLGRFTLSNIPPAPKGELEIEVKFEIDENGRLNVSAKEKSTGSEREITVHSPVGNFSKEEIEKMKREMRTESSKMTRDRRESKNEVGDDSDRSRDGKEFFEKGNKALGKGEYEEAIRYYEKATDIDPEYAEAWNNKGLAYYERGEHEEAIRCYKKVTDIDPKLAEGRFNKGLAHKEKGEFDKAIKCYDEATDIDSEYADAWYEKGEVYREKGDYEEAKRCFKKSLSIEPDQPEVEEKLEELQNKEQQRKMEEIHEKIEDLKDEEDMLDVRYIESALEENDVERAGELLDELEEKYQEYKETLQKLRRFDDKKSSLATRLADKEIDRDTYNDAVQNIETEKARLEEKLNKLRKEVIYEDYEKPF